MSVTVNGACIPEPDILAEMQYHPAPSRDEARSRAATALVIRRLLLDRAETLGLAPGESEERRIEAVLEQEVETPEADEDTCRRYYENNRRRFRSPDLFEASHILIPADPLDEAERDKARRKVEELIGVLTEDPSRFAELAHACSACPSAKDGGSLGQITRGQTVPELETFLYAMEEGQLCSVPVKTRYGFHVLYLHRKVEGKPLPFKAVHPRIKEYLAESSWRRGFSQYVQLLAGEADIKGLELSAATSPLVQ